MWDSMVIASQPVMWVGLRERQLDEERLALRSAENNGDETLPPDFFCASRPNSHQKAIADAARALNRLSGANHHHYQHESHSRSEPQHFLQDNRSVDK